MQCLQHKHERAPCQYKTGSGWGNGGWSLVYAARAHFRQKEVVGRAICLTQDTQTVLVHFSPFRTNIGLDSYIFVLRRPWKPQLITSVRCPKMYSCLKGK